MIGEWILQHFAFVNALMWAATAGIQAYRWRKFNRTHKVLGTDPRTGNYAPAVALQKIQWSKPVLPWAALGLLLYGIVQYFSTYPGSLFVAATLFAGGLLCVLIYWMLHRASKGTWKSSLIFSILFAALYLEFFISFCGYLLITGFK
jgi:hypothetical protein